LLVTSPANSINWKSMFIFGIQLEHAQVISRR
jgi:hypothetical protein